MRQLFGKLNIQHGEVVSVFVRVKKKGEKRQMGGNTDVFVVY